MLSYVLLLIVVAIVIMAVAVALRHREPPGDPTALPYALQSTLVSPAERSFLGVLDQASGEDCRVLVKVRVADVLRIEGVQDKSKRQSAFNRIAAKHFDFVLCNPDTLAPIAAIELDDRSHRRTSRQHRDTFLDKACETAGLPLIRISAANTYAPAEIREQLREVLPARQGDGTTETQTAEVSPSHQSAPAIKDSTETTGKDQPSSVQRAITLRDQLLTYAVEAQPTVCTYSRAHQMLLPDSTATDPRAKAKEVLRLAVDIPEADLPPLGPVKLDTFIVAAQNGKPSNGHWNTASYSRSDWDKIFGNARILR